MALRSAGLSLTGGTLTSTDPGAVVGPLLTLFRDSASPAVNDIIGGENFDGRSSAANQRTYASIRGVILSPTDGAETGQINFYTMLGGTLTKAADINQAGDLDMVRDVNAGRSLNGVGSAAILTATAIPAGGTAGSGYKFSSTANFGIFFGSGAPTLSAAQGSLYIRSDGSSTSTRLYVNNSSGSGTTWTAVTTAA